MTSTLPTWDAFMVPVLRVLADGMSLSRREIFGIVAQETHLNEKRRAEVLDSGQLRFENRISFAIAYLMEIKAVIRPSRAHYEITETGRTLLDAHPDGLTDRDLHLLEGYDHGYRRGKFAELHTPPVGDLDPYELVEQGVASINEEVANNLLDRFHARDPASFEQAVVDLVVSMGYGGSDARATRAQLSHDGGIDGIIDQDVLRLSRIYIQAKRYVLGSSVQRPDVSAFVGALQGQQANQGVFITMGRFSPGASEYARSVPIRVVLIDGRKLAELMIRYPVGVQVRRTLQIVDIDEDFFE